MDPQKSDAIEHQHIPQSHQGLHDFLYSAADEHAADTTAAPVLATGEMPISDWCDQAQNAKVAGVYAVLDRDRQTQFIGLSRNVSLSLRGHLAQKGDTVCALVKVQTFKVPKRDAMSVLRDEWIATLPSPPPGNVDGTWASTVREAATQVMSVAEQEAYEAKKLKLQRAMADDALATQPTAGSASDVGNPQADLAAAMSDDNWSALIREQTQETQT
ncbi:MAG: GIY-YIG nuclease family protein [Cyanobacteria bacterium P01_H01_bin.162]